MLVLRLVIRALICKIEKDEKCNGKDDGLQSLVFFPLNNNNNNIVRRKTRHKTIRKNHYKKTKQKQQNQREKGRK